MLEFVALVALAMVTGLGTAAGLVVVWAWIERQRIPRAGGITAEQAKRIRARWTPSGRW